MNFTSTRDVNRLLGPSVLSPEPTWLCQIPRKEVIHHQVPLAMPCYDLLLITDLTVVPNNKSPGASGIVSFSELTGGEYKARERIHRDVADSRLLAIPTSWSRVADSNPNLDRFFGISSTSRFGNPLYRPL